MTNVAVLCRVSTGKQDLETQRDQLRDYCKRRGYRIIKEYAEVESAAGNESNLWNQIQFDCRNGAVPGHEKTYYDILIVWSVDRLPGARSGPYAILRSILRLREMAVDVESLQEPFLSTVGALGEAVLIPILGWIATQEREKISERTKAGLARARKAGRVRPRGKDRKPRKTRKDKGYSRKDWRRKRIREKKGVPSI